MSTQQQLKSVASSNPLEKLSGIEKKRILRHFNSELTSYSSDNQTEVIIDISTPKELLDFQNGYLIFDIEAAGTPSAGTLVLNDWAASSWIREIRLEDRAGTQIGKAVNYYNGLTQMEYQMKSNDDSNSSYLDILEGAKAFTDAVDASDKKQFAHRFITHIFTSQDYFPNNLLSGLRIILTLESATNVVRQSLAGTVTTPSYTISNMTYACDVIELHASGMKALMKAQSDGSLVVDYLRTHSRRSTQMTDTQHFKIGVIDGAIKNVQMFTVLDSARNDGGEDFWSAYNLNNLVNYRFFLNNKPLTDKRIQINATAGSERMAEYVVEYVKSQKLNLDQLVFGGSALDLANRVVIGSRFDRAVNDDVISSLRDEDNNEIEIEVEYSSTGAAATTYFFVQTDQELQIMKDRSFRDVQVKPSAGALSTQLG